jgi:hypothetical protein
MAATLPLGVQSLRQERVEQQVSAEVAVHVARIEVSPSRRWAVEIPDDLFDSARSGRITIRARLPLMSGEFDDRIEFIPIDREGRRLPESILQLTGEFVPDVGCVPRELRFGRVRPGAVVEDTIYWRSLTGRPFTVRSVTSDSPHVTVGPIELVGGRPCCRVNCCVTKVGEQTSLLRVEVAEGEGPATTHTVLVFVVGVQD